MKSYREDLPAGPAAALSVLAWVFAVFFTVFFYSSCAVFVLPFSVLFDHGTRRLIHLGAVWWARCLMKTSPIWKLEVEGVANIRPGKNYVVVANHQSMLDILTVLAGLPLHFKFLAKTELFSVPFIGWHMAMAGYVPLARGNAKSGKQAVLEAQKKLRKGVSVLFFPEGTRSRDGEIHPFKVGAFKLALEEGVEILPVVIDGTGEAIPPKSWKIKKKTLFEISIGRPVPIPASCSDLPREVEKIREEMMRRLDKLRKTK